MKKTSLRLYSVSVIMYYEYIDGNQDDYYCWEDIILVKAKNYNYACDKAIEIGEANEDYSGKCMHNGRAVNIVCEDIRMYVDLSSYLEINDISELTNYNELIDSTFIFETQEKFEDYLKDITTETKSIGYLLNYDETQYM